ncbi:MAG: methyltransferase domain-containing protein [Candidatus Peribacteraceae bacterium]|nr:methyltransferase domain-containing protein [Candidatus Peribacteraceae bacterium]
MNNTHLFSSLAEKYKYRPGYPPQLLSILRDNHGLKQQHVIADIGSGTGLFAKLFLEAGNTVYCIEPNKEMFEKCVQSLRSYNNFKPLLKTAEHTSLQDNCVNFISIAQALHLFDSKKTREECLRIGKGNVPVILAWNFADLQSEYFRDYRLFLSRHTNYNANQPIEEIENQHLEELDQK